jgi:hypothetical protein
VALLVAARLAAARLGVAPGLVVAARLAAAAQGEVERWAPAAAPVGAERLALAA